MAEQTLSSRRPLTSIHGGYCREIVYYFTSLRAGGAKYCDRRMYVCPSVRISQKTLVQTSRNFLRVLLVVVTRICCDDNAIRYVLPFSWMM